MDCVPWILGEEGIAKTGFADSMVTGGALLTLLAVDDGSGNRVGSGFDAASRPGGAGAGNSWVNVAGLG